MNQRGRLVAGILLIVLGVSFAALPKEWIEETIGVEPDGGNGLIELLIAVVPIVAGVSLVVAWLLRAWQHVADRPGPRHEV